MLTRPVTIHLLLERRPKPTHQADRPSDSPSADRPATTSHTSASSTRVPRLTSVLHMQTPPMLLIYAERITQLRTTTGPNPRLLASPICPQKLEGPHINPPSVKTTARHVTSLPCGSEDRRGQSHVAGPSSIGPLRHRAASTSVLGGDYYTTGPVRTFRAGSPAHCVPGALGFGPYS